jgi:hypothetical protein
MTVPSLRTASRVRRPWLQGPGWQGDLAAGGEEHGVGAGATGVGGQDEALDLGAAAGDPQAYAGLGRRGLDHGDARGLEGGEIGAPARRLGLRIEADGDGGVQEAALHRGQGGLEAGFTREGGGGDEREQGEESAHE